MYGPVLLLNISCLVLHFCNSLAFLKNVSQAVEVSFEKPTTEFCQGYNTPAQPSFLDATKAQPMIGAKKTLGEAAPQEFQGYGAVIKSATSTA